MKAKTYEPRFERVTDERCPDCEYNGHLTNEGFGAKGTLRCGRCSDGRIQLLTWEDVLNASDKKLPKILANLARGRARIVRPSDTLDPYLIRKKG